MGWLNRRRSQLCVQPHLGGCGCQPSPLGKVWTLGCTCSTVPSLPQQHPSSWQRRGGSSAVSPYWESGQSSRSKSALMALLKATPLALVMPGGGEAWAIPVKITGYSEGQSFPPSSVCHLNYSASPRHCINEILSTIYFSRFFLPLSLFCMAVSHPSQTNCKAKFSVSQE